MSLKHRVQCSGLIHGTECGGVGGKYWESQFVCPQETLIIFSIIDRASPHSLDASDRLPKATRWCAITPWFAFEQEGRAWEEKVAWLAERYVCVGIFSIVAPDLWNSLLDDICTGPTLSAFHMNIKT